MPADAEEAAVTVEFASGAAQRAPVRRTVPYVEVAVEYPGLEPTRFGGGFFPVAVPYALGDEARVFFWESVLSATAPAPESWSAVAASPQGVVPATDARANVPVTGDDGRTVVVEGTVGGDSTEAVLADPVDHDVAVRVTDDAAVVEMAAGEHRVPVGDRRRVALPEREVALPDGKRTVAPDLVARYPGERTVYHPALDAAYDLFPSFGLDLDAVSERVAVDAGPQVDDAAVARELGVDLDARPYAERVLWQAFAHTAFGDPDAEPALAQFDGGRLALWT